MSASRRPPARVLVRRAPDVIAHWPRDRPLFQNWPPRARLSAAPQTLHIRSLSDDWRDPARVARRPPAFTPASLNRAVAALVKCSLLERSDRARTAVDRAFDGWAPWNPAAGLLHFSSKDLPY